MEENTIETATETATTNVDTTTEVKPKRTRRSIDRSTLIFGSGEWSINEAMAMNKPVSHATIYHYVKDQVRLGLMIQCGTRKSVRGKPTIMYRIATEADKTNTNSLDNQPFWL